MTNHESGASIGVAMTSPAREVPSSAVVSPDSYEEAMQRVMRDTGQRLAQQVGERGDFPPIHVFQHNHETGAVTPVPDFRAVVVPFTTSHDMHAEAYLLPDGEIKVIDKYEGGSDKNWDHSRDVLLEDFPRVYQSLTEGIQAVEGMQKARGKMVTILSRRPEDVGPES
ncbi:MAG TPA: hypothetical protein VG935_01245 [Patescibacteria group bacterium]|nr:hypothetical protein [Patescibacteria group bacterium]